jgi:hypothetical protein
LLAEDQHLLARLFNIALSQAIYPATASATFPGGAAGLGDFLEAIKVSSEVLASKARSFLPRLKTALVAELRMAGDPG